MYMVLCYSGFPLFLLQDGSEFSSMTATLSGLLFYLEFHKAPNQQPMKFIQRFKVMMCLLAPDQANPSAFQFIFMVLAIDIIDGYGLSSEVMNGI